MLTSFHFADPDLARLARKFVAETCDFLTTNRDAPGVGWPRAPHSPQPSPAAQGPRQSDGSSDPQRRVLILVVPIDLPTSQPDASLSLDESPAMSEGASADDWPIWTSEIPPHGTGERRRKLTRAAAQ